MVTWEVDVELIKIWFSRLDINSRAQVQAAIELLESEGP